ncbi:MAG: hypothetical protein ACI841_002171, partial [Planctomycetota bacterium]
MKSGFIAGVSPGLRTPLASILLMAENLESGRVQKKSRKQTYYGAIRREAVRINKLVLEFLSHGNQKTVAQLGHRAVLALASHLKSTVTEFPTSATSDPLVWLAQISELDAARLALETIETEGTLWRGRVLRALGAARVITEGEAWNFTARLLTSGSASARRTGLDHLAIEVQINNLEPIFETGMKHGDAEVRAYIAERMLDISGDNSLLRSHLDDTDERLRVAAVKCTRPRVMTKYSNSLQMGYQAVLRDPLPEGIEKSVAARARYVSPEVRTEVLLSLCKLPFRLSNDAYLALSCDPSLPVREDVFESLESLPVQDHASLILSIVTEGNETMREEVHKYLDNLEWTQNVQSWFPIAPAFLNKNQNLCAQILLHASGDSGIAQASRQLAILSGQDISLRIQ